MAKVGNLQADLALNTAQFTRGMRQAASNVESNTAKMNRAFAKGERAVQRSTASVGRFAKRALGLPAIMGTVAGTAGLGLLIKRSFDAADAIDKAAEAAGLSVERLQSLRFAAQQTGVRTKDLDDGMRRLNRRIGLFIQDGTGPAEKALERLGLAQAVAAGKLRGTGPILDAVIAQMGKLESQAEKVAVASQLFGDDAGPRLALLLSQGTDAVAKLEEQARRLGIVMEREVIENAVLARDKFAALSNVLSSRLTAAVARAAPQINKMLTGILNNLDDILAKGQDVLHFLGLVEQKSQPTRLAAKEREIELIRKRVGPFSETGEFLGETAEALTGRSLGFVTEAKRRAALAKAQAERRAIIEERRRPVMAPINVGPALEPRQEFGGLGGEPAASAGGGRGGAAVQKMIAETTAAAAKQQKQMRALAQTVRSETSTAAERYGERVQQLNTLVEQGFITQETYNRAVTQARSKLEAAREAAGAYGDQTVAVRAAVAEQIATQRILDRALDGNIRSFKDLGRVAVNVLRDILKAQIQVATFQGGAGGGGGGLLGTLVSGARSFFNLAAGGGSPIGGSAVAAATRVAGANAAAIAGGFQSGGSFTVGGRAGRDRNRVVMDLTRGERVSVETRRQARAGGAPRIVIGTIDNRGASVEAVQRMEQLMARLDASIEPRIGRFLDEEERVV